MKTLATLALVILLSAFIPSTSSNIELDILAMYYQKKNDNEFNYDRLIEFEGRIYELKGSIAFDDNGGTIQKLGEKLRVDVKKLEHLMAGLEAKNMSNGLGEEPKILFVQLKAGGDLDLIEKRMQISSEIEEALRQNNLGSSYGVTEGDNVANLEFEVQDWNKALAAVFSVIEKYKAQNYCLVGRRVYVLDGDYNVEILYPPFFDGSFNAF